MVIGYLYAFPLYEFMDAFIMQTSWMIATIIAVKRPTMISDKSQEMIR